MGLAIAGLLKADPRTSGIEIRVLDAGPPAVWEAESMDLRVYALSRASQRLYERLGVWTAIRASRDSPYRRMRVWEGEDPDTNGSISFDAADIGEPDLGHIVEDRLLRKALHDYLDGRERVDCLHQVEVESIARANDRIEVTTASGDSMRADLLIGADGGESIVREQLALPTLRCDYDQRAVVAHLRTSEPHAQTAWQRFLPTGPLAFLPLADGRSSIVWSLPTADAERVIALNDATFVNELEHASASVLGKLELTTPRASFPLRLLHAVNYCAQSVVLVGDAAHCVHPLAGQGMNLGLADAVALADVIAEAVGRGEHAADEAVLARYMRQRKAHNLSMQLAFDSLDRLFRLPDWAAPVRALGLSAVDRTAQAKRLLMRQALGLRRRAA